MQPDPAAIKILETSPDPAELCRASQVLAAAPDEASHLKVAEMLRSPTFLAKMDPAGVLAPTPMDLKVWRTLRALRQNKAPSAAAAIVSLVSEPVWLDDPNRVDLLLAATTTARPPDKKVIQFWERYTSPSSIHLHIMVGVLIDNGSEGALKVFERLLADPKHTLEVRRTWLRRGYPLHRTEATFVASTRRILASPAHTPEIKLAAIEALFDYQEAWGDMHEPVKLVPHAAAASAVKQDLRKAAEEAKTLLEIPPELGTKMQAVLATLGKEDSAGPDPR